MSAKIKYPYAIRVLQDRLHKEQNYLLIFNKMVAGKYGEQPKEHNIESCNHRIAELEGAIIELSSESMPEWLVKISFDNSK